MDARGICIDTRALEEKMGRAVMEIAERVDSVTKAN
jgi:hypothetical protein